MFHYTIVGYNGTMLLWAFLSWWYGAGWRSRARLIMERFDSITDYFSIGLLLRTLFSPFRQISAGKVRGSIDAQMRAFFDQLISRIIGAIVRTMLIVVGTGALVLTGLVGLVVLVLWAFVPLMPIAGVMLWLIGWLPSWM